MSLKFGIGRLAALLAGVAALTACLGDHFFRVQGRVVQCGTVTPLAGVTITGFVDKDFNGGKHALPAPFVTDAQGRFAVDTADEYGSWVTLTLEKAGFAPLSTQLKGATDKALELCLEPASTP
jgi:hypothetical protein